jgi:4a-hydroxytetrahydrobiopterin dehydratase
MSTSALLSASDTAHDLASSAFVHLDGTLYATYRTSDFASAAMLVAKVAEAADAMNHHPDVRLGYGTVGFELSSHDAGGVTERDVRLARKIHQFAGELGATGERPRPSRYELAIDCVDADAIRDCWRVGLDYVEHEVEDGIELEDPRGRGPRVWFQHMDPPRTDRNRIHLDVYVPTPDADGRVQAIVGAGGHVLTDEHAPDWWVLADVEGNELCVCTSPR